MIAYLDYFLHLKNQTGTTMLERATSKTQPHTTHPLKFRWLRYR